MKLLLDEMVSPVIADALRERGYEVVAATERPDMRGLPDGELFERAQREGRTLVTYNRDDFHELDRTFRSTNRMHHGIAILHPRRFPQGVPSVGALVASLEALLVAGEPYPSFVHWLE